MDEANLTRSEVHDLALTLLDTADVLDGLGEHRIADELRAWEQWLLDRLYGPEEAPDE